MHTVHDSRRRHSHNNVNSRSTECSSPLCAGGSGPLVVVIKVAGSLRRQPDKFFPPSLPDSIETIAVRQPNPGTPATTDGSESLGRRVRRRRTCRAAAARGFGCSTSRPTRRSPAWRAAPTARRSSRRTSRYPPPLTHLSPSPALGCLADMAMCVFERSTRSAQTGSMSRPRPRPTPSRTT